MLSGWARRGGGAGAGARCRRIRSTTTHNMIRGCPTYSRKNEPYAATLKNLQIGSHTRVIVQGFTGRNATSNSQESIDWGTNIVGGVVPNRKPGSSELHLGRPLFTCVRAAMENVKPDATAVYVPAHLSFSAIEEAIEAEVPLIVAVAEHIPVHDMLRIQNMLRVQSKSRLVGPNSPGIINVAKGNRCRIGFQPLPVYAEGCVGIVAKSGTLSYEAAYSTTCAGLGQSLCVGVGGDMLPGTDMDEALEAVVADENTKAVALIGEIGGDAEVRAAEWIEQYYKKMSGPRRKPIAFLLAGYDAPQDRVMGHAGAFWQPGDPTLEFKDAALQVAGARPVHHPSEFGPVLASLLDSVTAGPSPPRNGFSSETTTAKKSQLFSSPRGNTTTTQTRNFHLDTKSTMRLWKDQSDKNDTTLGIRLVKPHYLAIGFDRHTRDLCFWTCYEWSPDKPHDEYTKKPISISWGQLLHDPGTRISYPLALLYLEQSAPSVLKELSWDRRKLTWSAELEKLLYIMARLLVTYEAKLVAVKFIRPPKKPYSRRECISPDLESQERRQRDKARPVDIADVSIDLDDAAYREPATSQGVVRFPSEQYATYAALRPTHARDPESREAEAAGLVYHRLGPLERDRAVGIVINGAGMAMNTVDELRRHGVPAANFLDTGGLATSSTVSRSIDIILRDDRVRVLFVNVFGGLTKGDMIARGILQALEASAPEVPLVVRIQGTGAEEGRKLLRDTAERRFPGQLFTYGEFHEALRKVKEVVKETAEVKPPEREFKRTRDGIGKGMGKEQH